MNSDVMFPFQVVRQTRLKVGHLRPPRRHRQDPMEFPFTMKRRSSRHCLSRQTDRTDDKRPKPAQASWAGLLGHRVTLQHLQVHTVARHLQAEA